MRLVFEIKFFTSALKVQSSVDKPLASVEVDLPKNLAKVPNSLRKPNSPVDKWFLRSGMPTERIEAACGKLGRQQGHLALGRGLPRLDSGPQASGAGRKNENTQERRQNLQGTLAQPTKLENVQTDAHLSRKPQRFQDSRRRIGQN